VTQAPQYSVQSLQDLQNIPISPTSPTSLTHPEILNDVSSISRGNGLALVSHYNIRRVLDVFGSVSDRDLGAVGADITRIVDRKSQVPAARLDGNHSRPDPDHGEFLYRVCWQVSRSRSS